MNERIKQLLDQCTDPELAKPWPLIDAEKFAELIVKECAEICDEVQRRFGQYTFTARVCKEEIKEHFGVEDV